MAWFKADDRICEHPKFIAVRARGGHSTLGVWFHAGTWSNAMRTDGFIPRTWAVLNGAESEAVILVEEGLWHADAERDGWVMHDYAEYQPLRADVEAKSAQRAEAGKRGGSKSQANRKQTQSNFQVKGNPVPVPEPEPSALTEQRRARTTSSEKSLRNKRRLGLVAGGLGGTAA